MERPKAITSVYENKTGLLRRITEDVDDVVSTSSDKEDESLSALLHDEVLYATTEQKTLDILEICSGEVLGIMGKLLATHNKFLADTIDSGSRTEGAAFEDRCTEQARAFLDQLEKLTYNSDPETVAGFLSSSRKKAGFCTDIESLTRLGQVLSHLYTEGLLEKDNITIVHYPGSFNPFPHVGHAEVAEQVNESLLSDGTKNPRVVVSTVTRSEQKSIQDNFSDRVDNLVRGFIDHECVSVLGVPSDLTDQSAVIDFRQLVAKLDSQGKGRHVMGSDTLISRVSTAREGDLLSNYLINSGNTIFLSVRKGDYNSDVLSAIDAVKNEFDCELVVLPPPKYNISGTMVRELDVEAQRQYASSAYVKVKD